MNLLEESKEGKKSSYIKWICLDFHLETMLRSGELGNFFVDIKGQTFFLFFSATVTGGWSPWSEWSDCSSSSGCGSGTKLVKYVKRKNHLVICIVFPGLRRRERLCSDPAPKLGGKYCAGAPFQKNKCDTICKGEFSKQVHQKSTM